MGFMDNSGEIFLDAVLTDEGRERLARNDGSFAVVRFRFGDDEIDYRFWNELTGSDSKDRKILDTPVFEAFTNEVVALRYPLVSIRNARLQFLPQLICKQASVGLNSATDTSLGVTVSVEQQVSQAASIIPAEIFDVNYSIDVDGDLLAVKGKIPTAISPFGTAKYIIPYSGVTTSQGTSLEFNLIVQSLGTEIFDVLVGGTRGSRVINTTVIVTGQQSGMNVRIPVTITEPSAT